MEKLLVYKCPQKQLLIFSYTSKSTNTPEMENKFMISNTKGQKIQKKKSGEQDRRKESTFGVTSMLNNPINLLRHVEDSEFVYFLGRLKEL